MLSEEGLNQPLDWKWFFILLIDAIDHRSLLHLEFVLILSIQVHDFAA